MNSRKWRLSGKSFFLDYSTLCSQVIAEGANGPTTPEAEKVLTENKKLVIPVSLQRNSKCNLK